MKKSHFLYALALIFFAGCSDRRMSQNPEWPPVTRECKPWTYWWWPGSAVDEVNLTANLEDLSAAGMGGVHVIPIYGVRGAEDSHIPYLSPRWMDMLAHTVTEAKRLDMGVDMTSGTGWPFGGPNVAPGDASSLVGIETFDVRGGGRLSQKLETEGLLAVVACSDGGETIDLTDKVNAGSGSLFWTAPEGRWTIYAVSMSGTGQQVKRAAPGAEGNVLDYFSTPSLMRYLSRFDEAFDGYPGEPLRAFYNDSYEVYRSNWTDDLFDEFSRRRGYDLRLFLPAFLGEGDEDTAARVRHDYNETVSDILLERFTMPWVGWCHARGARTRNQAHGSPGNLLDLYAAADIPETEAFGPSGFPIPGLRVDPNIPEHFGKPDILVEKFASSAAHVAGKPLVSSESCTWLGEHFQVALSQVKPEIDALFTAGVNHVFFHGMAYSPKEAPWPGWLFYASTNFAQTGSFFHDLPELTSYIARCQSFLQSGISDNDILLYWPVHDRWREKTDDDRLHHFQVHNAGEWLYGSPLHDAARTMWDRGYAFDYISDRRIANLAVSDGGLTAEGGEYHTIVVPGCRYMPVGTLDAVVRLAREGATVIVTGALPVDVPGMGNLENNRRRFADIIGSLGEPERLADGVLRYHTGGGRILLGGDLESLLLLSGAAREPVVDHGVEFVRRRIGGDRVYFLTNLGSGRLDGWVEIAASGRSAAVFDPLTGRTGLAAVRRERSGAGSVYLQLDPGESLILRTYTKGKPRGGPWPCLVRDGDPVPVNGTWDVTFVDGGPEKPEGFTTDSLASWTDLGGFEAQSFHGTARYSIRFEKPAAESDEWLLDLGRVCESARVRLNGVDVGAAWCNPFVLRVGGALRDGDNLLEIDVTNLAANRIADMDRRGVEWKVFYDINYVSIKYEPFDASSWPIMDSGLLGPVMLVPCRTMKSP